MYYDHSMNMILSPLITNGQGIRSEYLQSISVDHYYLFRLKMKEQAEFYCHFYPVVSSGGCMLVQLHPLTWSVHHIKL